MACCWSRSSTELMWAKRIDELLPQKQVCLCLWCGFMITWMSVSYHLSPQIFMLWYGLICLSDKQIRLCSMAPHLTVLLVLFLLHSVRKNSQNLSPQELRKTKWKFSHFGNSLKKRKRFLLKKHKRHSNICGQQVFRSLMVHSYDI